MNLRAPAVPLITVDPFFSIWSMSDQLTDGDTLHWTGKPNPMVGYVKVNRRTYQFMGKETDYPLLQQTSLCIRTLSTHYTFEGAGIRLYVDFMTPLLQKNYDVMTRPISYIYISYEALDTTVHNVSVTLKAYEHLCLNDPGEMPVQVYAYELADNIRCIKMGSIAPQPILTTSGDDHRINWGYFHLAAPYGESKTGVEEDLTYISMTAHLNHATHDVLFTAAYNDLSSIVYFGVKLNAYWARDGEPLEQVILRAYKEYPHLLWASNQFHDDLVRHATEVGGEQYAELLTLSYRQVMAAHKLVLDQHNNLLYISKECFSNGCAATVDVSYPSMPMYLYYDTELIKGMLRPIFRYASSDAWPFDFAPHDVGTYPRLNGQVYSEGTQPGSQMPIEECGNMLIMTAATLLKDNDLIFPTAYLPLLEKWANYLIRHGFDPENQLCSDDFAGHLAHNCNLSIKAILGIASMGIIYQTLGHPLLAGHLRRTAQSMAKEWCQLAVNADGSYRLAFDQPGTYSMKYNLIWDKLLGTNLFPQWVVDAELQSYMTHMNPYGIPLDSRETYTKSDWLVWTASLSDDKVYFKDFIAPLWRCYNESASRVPMTDWYQTLTATQVGFQHRSVQGGLFIRLLKPFTAS